MPEQWRDGIDGADGEIVCLTISVMRPAPGWLDTAWRLSREADGVGGAIEPGDDLRLRDWAEYFCRYARDMLPFPARETVDFPGDNAVYTRDALAATHDVYRDGFWELEVNRALRERGLRALAFPRARRLPGTLGRLPGVLSTTPRPRAEVRATAWRPLLRDAEPRGDPASGRRAGRHRGQDVPRGLLATPPPPAADRGDAAAARLRHRVGSGRSRRARR